MNPVEVRNLSNISTQLFKLQNDLRASPVSFVPLLKERLQFYRDVLYFVKDRPNTAIRTVQGDLPVKQLIDELTVLAQNNTSLQPLELSAQLQRAASDHARDMGETGMFQHEGSNGKDLKQRVSEHAKWKGHLVENIECGYNNALDILLSLLIDDGLASRAHRKAIMNPDLKYTGIACSPHKVYGLITVAIYASTVASRTSSMLLESPGQKDFSRIQVNVQQKRKQGDQPKQIQVQLAYTQQTTPSTNTGNCGCNIF